MKAVVLLMFAFPVILMIEAVPDPSIDAVPDIVNVPVAVSPVEDDAPMVMLLAAWVMFPVPPPALVTVKLNVPIAIVVIAAPVVSNEAIVAFWFTVEVPAPDVLS